MNQKTTKFFALAACLALGVGALAGCGEGGQASSGAASTSGGAAAADIDSRVFNYGVTAYSGSGVGVDPHSAYCGWSTLRYGIGETLTRISDEGTIEPWLAESWTANDDSTEWTLKIKDNVTFSNGKKVDAAAVKANFERLIAQNERAATGLKIASMEADGQTLTFKLSSSNPILVNWMTDPFACIIDVTEEVNGESHVVGTGPYTLEKANVDGVVVKANKNYWNGSPKFGTVNVICFQDGDTMSLAAQNGELDACANLGYDTVPVFQNNSKFNIDSTATSRSYMFMFNTKDEALSDIKVRQAISCAINKDAFVNTLMNGFGEVAQLCFPKSYTFGDSKVKGPEYNPEQAKKLLAEAGWTDTDGDGYVDKDGKNLELSWVTYRNRQELPLLAESSQAALKEVGIKVNIDDREGNAIITDVSPDFDIYSWAVVTAPYADGLTFFNELLNNYSGHGWSGAEYEQFKSLYETAIQENDAEKRAEYSVQLQQMLVDNNILFVASHNTMNLVTKAGVSGMAAHPTDFYEITVDVDRAD